MMRPTTFAGDSFRGAFPTGGCPFMMPSSISPPLPAPLPSTTIQACPHVDDPARPSSSTSSTSTVTTASTTASIPNPPSTANPVPALPPLNGKECPRPLPSLDRVPSHTKASHISIPMRPPSTSRASKASLSQPGISFLVRMAMKMFGVVSRRLDKQSSVDALDAGMAKGPSASTYQQSSTRRLAFGSDSEAEAVKRPVDDFYNNSTLTNLSKVFCAVVLLTAFFLVMSRSLKFDFFPYLT